MGVLKISGLTLLGVHVLYMCYICTAHNCMYVRMTTCYIHVFILIYTYMYIHTYIRRCTYICMYVLHVYNYDCIFGGHNM